MSRRRRLVYQTAVATVVLIAAVVFMVSKKSRPGEEKSSGQSDGITNTLKRELPADCPAVTFTDVTTEAGIDFEHFSGIRSTLIAEDMGSGAAWGDYDNDGDDDLFLVNFVGPLSMTAEQKESAQGNTLYRNNGDGTFTDVTSAALLDRKVFGMGAQFGDFDGDNYLDLFVTCYGENILYRNDGDGTFSDVTKKAGVGGDSFSAGAAFADFDLDGDLDLYVGNYVAFRVADTSLSTQSSPQYQTDVPFTLNPSSYKPQANNLYRNNGDGTFTDIAISASVDNPTGRSLSVSFCDLDFDGYPDLYVANDVSANGVFRNLGDGTFSDIGASSWAADYRGAMGLAFGDFDNDLDFDIFITHWIGQENALYSNMFSELKGIGPDSLRFRDVADLVGLGQSSLSMIGWGTEFFDYDNDGKLDLLVVNGSTFENPSDRSKLVAQDNMLFWNRGERGYFDVSTVAGNSLIGPDVARGAAMADYDNDGDIDILVMVHSGSCRLLRNDGGSENNWLKIKLAGSRNNRNGIGAQIKIVAGGITQIREVGSGTSYLSQNSLEIEFGLGKSESIDTLEVRWPSGEKQLLTGLPVNQTKWIRQEDKR